MTETNQELGFLSDEGIDITKRVKEGKITLFTEEKKAKAYSSSKRSYKYRVDSYIKRGGGKIIIKHFGYAVPK